MTQNPPVLSNDINESDNGLGYSNDWKKAFMACCLRESLSIIYPEKPTKKKQNKKSSNNNNNNITAEKKQKIKTTIQTGDCKDTDDEDEGKYYVNDGSFLQQHLNLTTKRLMYDYRLLHYAYQFLKEKHPELFTDSNELVSLGVYYFESFVRICVEPFDECIDRGNLFHRALLTV